MKLAVRPGFHLNSFSHFGQFLVQFFLKISNEFMGALFAALSPLVHCSKDNVQVFVAMC